jgi:hypothetical protein
VEEDDMARAEPEPAARYVGESVNRQGNKQALRRMERGRLFVGRDDTGRPRGRSTARFSSGVNPQESITGDLYLPPG